MNILKNFALKLGNILDFRNIQAETIFGFVNILVGISIIYAPIIGTVATVDQLIGRNILAWALIVSGTVIGLSTFIPMLSHRSLELFIILSLPFVTFASISIVSFFLGLNKVVVPTASIVYLGFYFLSAKTIFEKYDTLNKNEEKDKEIN